MYVYLQMGLAVGLQITVEWSMRVEIGRGVNALRQLTLDYFLYVYSAHVIVDSMQVSTSMLVLCILLQDLSPGDTYSPLALEIITYIGTVISVVCLVIVILTYSSSKYVPRMPLH